MMMNAFKNFTNYFDKKKLNRILRLNCDDSCEITAKFKGVEYFIVCNSMQYCILCALNNQSQSTYGDLINTIIGGNEEWLQISLRGMCQRPYNLIIKENMKSPDFELKEMLTLNEQYSNPKLRISVQPRKPDEAITESCPTIQKHRDKQMDACIVKIMKMLKTITYNDLVAKIYPLITQFPVEISHIKRRIEYLIGGEYMKRGKDNKEFIYISQNSTL